LDILSQEKEPCSHRAWFFKVRGYNAIWLANSSRDDKFQLLRETCPLQSVFGTQLDRCAQGMELDRGIIQPSTDKKHAAGDQGIQVSRFAIVICPHEGVVVRHRTVKVAPGGKVVDRDSARWKSRGP